MPAFLLQYSLPLREPITSRGNQIGASMETVREYIDAVRTLLQDTHEGAYRYSDDNIKLALHLAFTEAYRLRPDMFVGRMVPNMLDAGYTTVVPAPEGYQSAFMYYAAGHVQLQDQEDTQDNRASVFLNKFTSQLLSTAA